MTIHVSAILYKRPQGVNHHLMAFYEFINVINHSRHHGYLIIRVINENVWAVTHRLY